MRRFTYKRFARAALIRGVGREISASNRKRKSKKQAEERKIVSQVFNGNIIKKSTTPLDHYKDGRKAIHGKSMTVLTRKDGGVDCPVCSSNMGQPSERGLFHKHFEYKCPNCGIIAEIK